LSPHCSVKRCKKLKVRSASEVSLESDGEIFGNSPFDIEIYLQQSWLKLEILTINDMKSLVIQVRKTWFEVRIFISLSIVTTVTIFSFLSFKNTPSTLEIAGGCLDYQLDHQSAMDI